MKTLYLMRHAKSDWTDSSQPDHDRPLNDRGREAAPMMGAHLQEGGHQPEVVICSTATRTRETLEALLEQLDVEPAVHLDPQIYLASPGEMLEVLRELPDTVDSALMVAHNPGTAILADALCSEGPASGLNSMRYKFPTAALAIIEMDVNGWDEVRTDCGRLIEFKRPRDLK